MRQAVQQWKESGLTQKAYCQTIGVRRTTFANWVRRNKEVDRGGFVKIVPKEEPGAQAVEVIYPNGVCIKTACCQVDFLSRLIHLY